jgi:putative transposase
MCDATGLSQRRACRLTGLSLSTCRYEAQRPAADAHLSGRITELALERRRFGYRRIWQLLRREGLHVNHKRVYRIYHLNGLSVKRRRRRKGLATERFPLLRPDAPNLTWSMDFVMDALANGRRIKCLTCVDDFTKECLTITAAFGISGVQVTRILDSIALFRGYPATIRTDQGRNLPAARSINGPLSMVWNYGLSSQVSQRRTDLLRVLTDAFAMSV